MAYNASALTSMPFTLAHPAAVLPFHSKWRTGFLALVIGSLGPDIQYFLPVRIGDSLPNSHTAFGAIAVGVPMSLLLFTFAVSCRRAIVAPMWGWTRLAVERTLDRAWQTPMAWLHAVPAAAVGCEIHVLWDSFTHTTGWAVRHFPLLSRNLSPVAEHPLELFRVLQYGSSIVGMVFIALWCRRHIHAASHIKAVAAGWRPWAWLSLLAISSGVAWYAARHAGPGRTSLHGFIYVAVTVAVGVFTALYVLLGAIAATLPIERTTTVQGRE
jgi:hypothetical protein